MCQFTDAIPSGEGAIGTGTNVCIGVNKVINVDIGCGQVTQLDGNDFIAAGNYDFDVFGYKGQGTWALGFQSADGGNTWTIKVVFTGTYVVNEAFQNVTCTEGGSGNTTITYNTAIGPIVQSFQNDSIFEKAKIWFSVPFEGNTWSFYFFSTDFYSGQCGATGC